MNFFTIKFAFVMKFEFAIKFGELERLSSFSLEVQ